MCLILFDRLFEELKNQHDSERNKLVAECEELRKRLHELEDKMRQEHEELLQHKRVAQEKNDINEYNIIDFFWRKFNQTHYSFRGLEKKNSALRQSLSRVRLSRESFRNRLKSTTFARKMECGAEHTIQVFLP